MAFYGISFYGQSTYGAPLFVQLEARGFKARPHGYTGVFLDWQSPSGTGDSDWDLLRLVRSSYGFPASPYDGVLLFEDARATARTSYLDDDGLQPGRFYYYSLFARLTVDGSYRPAGNAVELVTVPHNYGPVAWELLPSFYKESDVVYKGVHDHGPLRRFAGLIGYQADRIRSEVDTMLDVANIDLVSGGLLPVLADSLGVTYEPELGMRISRGIIKNAIRLSKTKGTRPGIEGVASAYTGFGAVAEVGKNLMLDKNSSGFVEPTTSTWTVVTNTVLTANAEQAYSPPVADTATMTATAVASANMVFASGLHADLNLMPVTAGTTYTASLYTMHLGTARTVTPSIVYYDFDGAVVGTFNGSATANTGAWVRRSVTGLAPAGAVWAALQVTVAAPGAGEAHLFGAAQFEEGAAVTAWEPARRINITLEPERANLAPNPSFETNTTGWAGTATTLARVTTQFVSGAASMSLTKITAAGIAVATTPTGTSGIPVVAGETYTVSASFRPNTTTRGAQVGMNWYNAAGAYVDSTVNVAVTETAGAWTRVSHTVAAPATAAYASLTVQAINAAVNEVHYVDAVLFEQSEFVKEYFDASLTPTSDFLWAGAAHASASLFYPRREIKNSRLSTIIGEYLPPGTDYATFYTQ